MGATDDEAPVKPAARDQMQLHLTKENESPENDSAWRRNLQKTNTQQDSPPKTRKCCVFFALSSTLRFLRDLWDV